MAIPKRKSLAGTCGIPQEKDRVYVKTFDKDGLERTYPPDTVPKRISAPFLGTWDIQASSSRREFGRFSGSLITRTWYMSAPSRCSYHAFAVHTRGLSSHCGIACIAAPSRGACIMENGRTDCVVITSKPHPSFSFDPSFE